MPPRRIPSTPELEPTEVIHCDPAGPLISEGFLDTMRHLLAAESANRTFFEAQPTREITSAAEFVRIFGECNVSPPEHAPCRSALTGDSDPPEIESSDSFLFRIPGSVCPNIIAEPIVIPSDKQDNTQTSSFLLTQAVSDCNLVDMTTATQTRTLKDFRFGIELETVGAGVNPIATALGAHFGVTPRRVGDYYQTQAIAMADGREWKVMTDGSLSYNGAEVVSPVLTYADIETMQDVIRVTRRAGGKIDNSCGVHIHVDGAPFKAKPRALANLCKLVNQQEELMRAAFGTSDERTRQWCKPIAAGFIAAIDKKSCTTLQNVRDAWYANSDDSDNSRRYNSSRYRGVNLHCLFNTIGTIEFRYFNGTLHAGKAKAYVQFVLAFAARAYNARSARSSKRKANANVKYAFRTLMLRLNLIGDEFKTCRLHLMKDLPGTQNGLPVGGRPAGYASAAAPAVAS